MSATGFMFCLSFHLFQVVGEGVLDASREIIFKLDLRNITTDEFQLLFRNFETAVDLCPIDARTRMSDGDVTQVNSCLDKMSNLVCDRTRRTDYSDEATDFASAVFGACCLAVEREMPSKYGRPPIPDALYKEDTLSNTEV